MATILLRTGLRAVMSKSVLEKRAISSMLKALSNFEQDTIASQQGIKFSLQTRYMSSKRNVHHTRASAVTDEESDSDSDSEDERGVSHFWRRKMRTLHSHLDVNKDGVISYDDFKLLEERFTNLGHLTPKEREEFENVLRVMWQEQWGDISPYNHVSIEKYLEEMHHVVNDRSLKQKYHHFLPYLFKAVDKDQDGDISVEEFKLFFQCLGLTNDHAVVSFSHIDTNDDGKISLHEFVTLGRDFFITEDDTRPSKHFWGPLIN